MKKYPGIKLEKNGTYTLNFKPRTKDGYFKSICKRGFETPEEALNYKIKLAKEIASLNSYELEGKTELQAIITNFLNKQKNKIELKTYLLYERALGFLSKEKELSINTLDRVYQTIITKEVRPQTKNLYIGKLIMFFEWCFINEYIDDKTYKYVMKTYEPLKINASDKNKKNIVNLEDFEKILSDFKNESPIKPILAIMFYCGTRVSETMAISVNDINVDKMTIVINKQVEFDKIKTYTKNHGSRIVKMPKKCLEIINDYLDNVVLDDEYLFFKRTTSSTINRILDKESQKYELPHLSAHCLRHSFTTLMANKTDDFKALAEQLGHKSINTTREIYEHLTEERKDKLGKVINDVFD